MRWTFLICLLLVSAVLAKPRPKRSLGYIKSFISNKLFGSKTIVIAQPTLAKNQTYQLFKIPGFDNILIKVTRTNEHVKEKPVKVEDAVIVKPEVAIIGSYLGTRTEKETMLAIEMVKSLLQSGVLTGVRGNSAQEVMFPMMPQQNLEDHNGYPYSFTKEQGSVFVPIAQVDTLIPSPIEFPPLFVEEPGQSKYSYTQKGSQADTTYESINNGDVVVTRTMKEPPYPQFIKLRIAEVATIGANPYMLSPYKPLEVNSSPIPVPYYVNPAIMTDNVQQNQFIPDLLNPYDLQNMRRVIICKEKYGKMCPHENLVVKSDKDDEQKIVDKPNQSQDTLVNVNINKSESNANRIAVNEFLKNQSTVNGQFVSQYLYRQMNHHSHDNYTVVKVGEAPKLSHEVNKNSDINKNFVFMPPKDIESSMLNVLSLHNEAVTETIGQKQDEKNAFISKVITNEGKSYVPSHSAFSKKLNNINSFEDHPIVVTELGDENKEIEAKANEDVETEDGIDEHRRGDIPGSTY